MADSRGVGPNWTVIEAGGAPDVPTRLFLRHRFGPDTIEIREPIEGLCLALTLLRWSIEQHKRQSTVQDGERGAQ